MSDNSKVILITGASSGIGKATAEYLAQKGHIIYGTSRYPGSYPKPVGYNLIQMDVNDIEIVQSGIENIIQEYGRIDIVINNAGVHVAGSIEDTPVEKAKEQEPTTFNVFSPRGVGEVLKRYGIKSHRRGGKRPYQPTEKQFLAIQESYGIDLGIEKTAPVPVVPIVPVCREQ